MSQSTFQTGDILNFEAGEALPKYRLLKQSGGTVVFADAADGPDLIGVVSETHKAVASGAQVGVRMWNGPGTKLVETTAAAVAVGDLLKCANDGKVVKVGTTTTEGVIGRAKSACDSSGGVIEVVPFVYHVRDLS